MKKILNLCAVSLISLMVVSCGRQEVTSSELKPVEMENSTTQASQDSTSLNTSSSENSTLISSSEETSSESISSESSSVGPVLKEFPNELFISEFYNIRYNLSLAPEAGNNDKAIEIYNPTDEAISLANYSIAQYSNGSTTPKETITFTTKDVIQPKTAYTIVHLYSEHLLPYADKEDKVFIGAKSAVALYKGDEMIDVFGTIGKSYGTNYEFVINGTESATEPHNVKRVEGKRAKTIFDETEWIVATDSDFSSLGIHEDDQISKVDKNAEDKAYKEGAVTALTELVETYYSGNIATGKQINLVNEYKGYKFEYSFEFVNAGDTIYVNDDGTLTDDFFDGTEDNFSIWIRVFVLNKEGTERLTLNTDADDYAYVTYRTTESLLNEKKEEYENVLKKLLKEKYDDGNYIANGDIPTLTEYDGYKLSYSFSSLPCSNYYDEDGKIKVEPETETKFAFTISIYDKVDTTKVITSIDVNCEYLNLN